MKQTLFAGLALLLALSCKPGLQETRLENWEFSRDGETWEQVCVPHSYNALDGHSTAYYRGEARYRTTLPVRDKDAVCFLRFEGAAQKARIYLN